MDIDQKIAVLVQTISHQGGRIDALASALTATLHIARETPGLAARIEGLLERQYAELLARSENTDYVAGFDSIRDAVVKSLHEQPRQGADAPDPASDPA